MSTPVSAYSAAAIIRNCIQFNPTVDRRQSLGRLKQILFAVMGSRCPRKLTFPGLASHSDCYIPVAIRFHVCFRIENGTRSGFVVLHAQLENCFCVCTSLQMKFSCSIAPDDLHFQTYLLGKLYFSNVIQVLILFAYISETK